MIIKAYKTSFLLKQVVNKAISLIGWGEELFD